MCSAEVQSEGVEDTKPNTETDKTMPDEIIVHVKGEECGFISIDAKTAKYTILNRETLQTIFGCQSSDVPTFLGVGIDAIFEFRTDPKISSRTSFTIDIPSRTVIYNQFAKLPSLPEKDPEITEDDCEWALQEHFNTLVGGKEEGEVFKDYLAAHWQQKAIGKCTRNRPNDIVIVGEGGTGKDLNISIMDRSFPSVYTEMSDADLDPSGIGNNPLFTSSLLIMNENEGSKRFSENSVFKRFCDSPSWRFRAMLRAAEQKPRCGLCIRYSNKLGLTVDHSTARKIAFFQSGESAIDPITLKPKDPEKSARLERILMSSNFILWFRELLAARQIDVDKVIYGHGAGNFKKHDSSDFFTLLQAIEAGETLLDIQKTGFVDVKEISAFIKKECKGVGQQPSKKIGEMIKSRQLLWEEKRYPSGRLHGYVIPVPENNDESVSNSTETIRGTVNSSPVPETIISTERLKKYSHYFADTFAQKTEYENSGCRYNENADLTYVFRNKKPYVNLTLNLTQQTACFTGKQEWKQCGYEPNKDFEMWGVLADLLYGADILQYRERAKRALIPEPSIYADIDVASFCKDTGLMAVKQANGSDSIAFRFEMPHPEWEEFPFVIDVEITSMAEWDEFSRMYRNMFRYTVEHKNGTIDEEEMKRCLQEMDDLERSMPEAERQRLDAEWEALPKDEEGNVIIEQIFPDDPLPIHYGGQSPINDDQWKAPF